MLSILLVYLQADRGGLDAGVTYMPTVGVIIILTRVHVLLRQGFALQRYHWYCAEVLVYALKRDSTQ